MSDKKIIGIDLGGTTTKFGIVDREGKIQEQWQIKSDISSDGQNVVPNIIHSINEQLSHNNLTADDFIGIGMGSPGTVNREQGTVIGAYNLNWKTVQEVRERIETGTQIPFSIDNDANVAALGEQWVGAGNNKPNVLFITLGTGVGGGIIADGQLVHGSIDAAGEIGHVTVEPDGYLCTCGKKGCLEQYASAKGIIRLAQDHAATYTIGTSQLKDLIMEEKALNAKMIFDLAKTGDQFAVQVVDQFAYYLGIALANAANILNPAVIVLGGGLSRAGDFLAKRVRENVKKYIFPTMIESTEIKLAELGNDAGIIGAASLVLNEI